MVDVAEVASWSDQVLDELGVNEVTSHSVNKVADCTIEAVRDIVNTHVGATDGHVVANLTLNRAALDDVTSEKGTLRQSHYIDLIDGELLHGEKILASLVCLIHEVVGDRSDGTVSDFDAFSVVTSLSLDLLGEAVHARVDASITQSVEDCSWDGGNGGSGQSGSECGSHLSCSFRFKK